MLYILIHGLPVVGEHKKHPSETAGCLSLHVKQLQPFNVQFVHEYKQRTLIFTSSSFDGFYKSHR
jgi:hypothetical protein